MGSGKESRMMLEKFLASLPRALAWMDRLDLAEDLGSQPYAAAFRGGS